MRPARFRLLLALTVTLHQAAEGASADPLFQSHDILDVTIIAPLKKIVRERSTKDYEPGTFRLVDRNGTVTEFSVKIRARGNFRRENCDHPPAWLNFRKSEVRGTVFENQNKLKIVVHCERPARFEQIVLREYLAYRILNELTDRSFRVRLLRATYIDVEDDVERPPRYAFLIEHKKRLAARLERKLLDIERTSVSALDPAQLNLASVFQYFIGNTDFSPIAAAPGNSCCHNYVLLGDGADSILPVPYDFDQSGFVGAPYASPDPRLGIRSVRARLYRGTCVNNDRLPESLQRFREKRDTIYALIADQPGLEPRTRTSLLRYTDDFFELIEDPGDVRRRLADRCL
jgi:hypothetical protein